MPRGAPRSATPARAARRPAGSPARSRAPVPPVPPRVSHQPSQLVIQPGTASGKIAGGFQVANPSIALVPGRSQLPRTHDGTVGAAFHGRERVARFSRARVDRGPQLLMRPPTGDDQIIEGIRV